jgi:hypothetical protein
MGDARTHLARADHSNFFQLGCHRPNPAPLPHSNIYDERSIGAMIQS